MAASQISLMPEKLELVSSQVPVTALEAWNDLVLVGQGHFLRIYNRKTTELLSSTKVFTQQSIHGFVRQKGTKDGSLLVTIWGGRNVCFANVTREERESTTRITVDVRNTVEIDEWIFDVSLRPGIHLQSAQDAVLVTAHNKLFRLNVSQANELEIEHLFSGPRCILYSATIKWISTDQVVVASGTAFGEIVVWSLSFASNLIQAIRHFIFTGHEGSVFGVQISNHLSSREEPQLRLLTSCSDDRTIRVWDISNLSAGVVLAQTTPDEDATDTSRTTGFLNYVSDDAETASKSLYIASAMGHTSRIWNIHYAIDQDYQKFESYIISIISVGEDAACQIWHLYRGDEASNLGGFVLREGNSGNHHSGMNIWSSCVREFDESAHSFVTGGADGKVVEHQALLGDRGLCTPHMSTSEWDMTDFTTSLPISIESTALQDVNLGTNKKQSKKLTKLNVKPDCFRTFAFVCETQLLLTTNNGHVILVNLDEENAKVSSWRLIATYDSLKGYSVSCRLTSEPFHYLFLGDSRGNVYYFHSFFEEMKILTTIGGKITKLMAESLPSRSPDYLSIIVARHGGLETVQLLVKLGFGGTLILSSTTTFSCHYGQEKGTVPTITSSVLVTANSVDKDIALGCRDGSIYLYSNTRDQSDHCDAHLLLTHGGEAVTAMLWLPDPGGRNHSGGGTIGFLYSVGRDGTLAIHYIDAEENCFLFVHQLALPFGPNLEGLSLDPHTFDVSVWGFSGKHFVHHNVSALEDIFRIECGGAHRIWTFYNHKSSSTGSTKAMLGWLKIMKLNLTKVKGASHIVIQGGGHGREMTACAVAPVALNKDIGPLIATGAEDTDISLFYYAAWHGPCSELKLISILRKHNTGIQYLRWSEDGEFLFSCGGMEEFFVWRMRPTPGVTIGVVCEAVCPPMSPDSELRLLDFAVQGVYSAGNIPTGRVTAGRATKIRGANAKIFMITMIYSDSSFKIWKYSSTAYSESPGAWNNERAAWSLLASSNYTTACLTVVTYLSHSPSFWPLVTASTDGHLAIWSLTANSRQLVRHGVQPVHQNSVKSMASLELTASAWVVVTGGDDNALGFTLVTMKDSTEEYDSATLLVPRAHAAAITAVAILSVMEGHRTSKGIQLLAVTASNDQRIKLWRVNIDLRRTGSRGVKVVKEGAFVSAVADISSLALFPETREEGGETIKLLIGGIGTEIWKHHCGLVGDHK